MSTEPSPSSTINALGGQVHREPETDGRREPHRVLQVEEVFAVAEVVELLRATRP